MSPALLPLVNGKVVPMTTVVQIVVLAFGSFAFFAKIKITVQVAPWAFASLHAPRSPQRGHFHPRRLGLSKILG